MFGVLEIVNSKSFKPQFRILGTSKKKLKSANIVGKMLLNFINTLLMSMMFFKAYRKKCKLAKVNNWWNFDAKKYILEQSLILPTKVIAGDENCYIYAAMKEVDQKILCRMPKCKSTFTGRGSRTTHERTVHPRKTFSCKKSVFFAENRTSIDNHNFRLHRAVEVKNTERYVIYVICYFRINKKLSHLHRVNDVLPSETIVIERKSVVTLRLMHLNIVDARKFQMRKMTQSKNQLFTNRNRIIQMLFVICLKLTNNCFQQKHLFWWQWWTHRKVVYSYYFSFFENNKYIFNKQFGNIISHF